MQPSHILCQKAPSTIMPDGKPDVVAYSRRNGSDDNDVRQVETVFGVGQKTGQEQNSLSGNGQPPIFQQQGGSNRPMPILSQIDAQKIESMLRHHALQQDTSGGGQLIGPCSLKSQLLRD